MELSQEMVLKQAEVVIQGTWANAIQGSKALTVTQYGTGSQSQRTLGSCALCIQLFISARLQCSTLKFCFQKPSLQFSFIGRELRSSSLERTYACNSIEKYKSDRNRSSLLANLRWKSFTQLESLSVSPTKIGSIKDISSSTLSFR